MKPNKTTLSVSVVFVFAAVLMTACAGRIEQQSVLDTPEAHYQAGMELLRQQKVEEARAEFEYAIGLDRSFAPGYEGIGLCELEWGRGREAEREFKRSLDRDRRYVPAHVGLGRAYNMQDRPRPAIRSFEDAIEINSRYADAYEYLGQTHVQLRDFDSAVDTYRRGIGVLPDNTALNDSWQRVSEIQRATIGVPERYMEIALTEAVSRAELAVLLNEELDLEGIFQKRTQEEARFVAPGQQQAQAQRQTVPNDVASDYWARVQIEQAVKFGAMDLFPDGTFRSNQVVTRLDLALLIQRVLVEAFDDDSLKSKFFGNTSPFPDVMSTHFSFNAVMLATTRGIMDGKPDGTFLMEGTLPGHEAILIIRNLKGALR